MRYCLLPIAYCLLVVLPSCKPKTDYSKEISRLDSAATRLIESGKDFLSADTNSFRTAYNFSNEKLKLISEKVSKDTVKKDLVLLLADAYEHINDLHNILENKPFLQRAISEGEQRIADLKHDLSEDLHEKNKSEEYVVNEINASQKLSDAVKKTIDKAKEAVIQLDSMKTRIIFVADSLTQ